MRPRDRERIQVEVAHRVVSHYVAQSKDASEEFLQTVANDTLYCERRRLEHVSRRDKRAKVDRAFYRGLRKQLPGASDATVREILEKMAKHFVAEVVGNFDERIYNIATGVLPTGLSVLLNATSPSRLLDFSQIRQGLTSTITLQGETEHVKRLADKGTLVVVPTHSSNLDSVVLGYGVYLVGLPPLLYGAGINLFSNPLVSFFMHNLGAYRVDRKKTSRVYKNVLKTYAQTALEMGYHQLFFPGGTRSRSGAVEQRLKKGLLGTAVRGYVQNLKSGATNPNIYIVPCTLSYKLVLEAETLIGDYLTDVGKSRYIIDDDEFSRPRRVYNFFANTLSLDDEIILTFSKPMDVFGNYVDLDGNSLDPRGRRTDAAAYVCHNGEPVLDEQRDMEYCNQASDKIKEAFLRDNVIMSTNLVGRAMFNLLRRNNPGLDLYRLLHTGGAAPSFSMADVHLDVQRLLDELSDLPARPRLSSLLASGDVQEIVADALSHFGTYHSKNAVERRGDRIFHEDRNLLYYYSNRLDGYGLERVP